jgi:hypothetical protein
MALSGCCWCGCCCCCWVGAPLVLWVLQQTAGSTYSGVLCCAVLAAGNAFAMCIDDVNRHLAPPCELNKG